MNQAIRALKKEANEKEKKGKKLKEIFEKMITKRKQNAMDKLKGTLQ